MGKKWGGGFGAPVEVGFVAKMAGKTRFDQPCKATPDRVGFTEEIRTSINLGQL